MSNTKRAKIEIKGQGLTAVDYDVLLNGESISHMIQSISVKLSVTGDVPNLAMITLAPDDIEIDGDFEVFQA